MLSPRRLYLYRFLTFFLPESSCFPLKRALLRFCGASVGAKVRICSSATFLGAGKLSIGDNSWIGHGAMLVASGELIIGNNVDIGPMVYIGNGTHEIDVSSGRCAGKGVVLPVIIGDGSWICAKATVLPGVDIGARTVVAAGSVVTVSTSGECLVAGVPASVKKVL